MRQETLLALAEGNIRPRRVYEKEFRASACGRTLLKEGSGGERGVLLVPGGTVVTTEGDVAEAAKEMGFAVFMVEALSEEGLRRAQAGAVGTPQREAIKWILGR